MTTGRALRWSCAGCAEARTPARRDKAGIGSRALDRRRSRRAVWRQFDAGREPNGRASRGFEAACDAERADSCASLSGKVFPSAAAVTIKAPCYGWFLPFLQALRCGRAVAASEHAARPRATRTTSPFIRTNSPRSTATPRGGLVAPADAEGAKAEAARRLLAAAEAALNRVGHRRAGPRDTPPRRRLVFVPAAGGCALCYVGHPDLPDLRFRRASRTAGPHGSHGGDREDRGASGARPQ